MTELTNAGGSAVSTIPTTSNIGMGSTLNGAVQTVAPMVGGCLGAAFAAVALF